MNPPDLPARPATDLCLFMARWLSTGVGLSPCLNQTGKQGANCYGIPHSVPSLPSLAMLISIDYQQKDALFVSRK